MTNLYNESHNWLISFANKITKNRETSEDVVMELYEYLHTKQNIKLFWGPNSYNLKYCTKFIHHRFINKTKKLNRTTYVDEIKDIMIDEEYDTELDLQMQKAHEDIIQELKRLEITKMWPSARIFELYWMSDDTLDEVSSKIGISKSTTFLAVKKIRRYLKEVIDNPFNQ